MMKTKKCYGKRLESKDECEKCEQKKQCSVMTLEIIFGDKIITVVD